MALRRNPRLWRATWPAAVALGCGGSILIALAVLAGPLGLGLAEDFVLYRLFGLPRRTLALVGLVLGLLGLVLLATPWLIPSSRAAVKLAQNSALVILSTVFTILVLEVAVRLVDGVPLWPPRNLVAARAALLTVQTANEYHPVLGWVLKPGIRSHPDKPDASFTTGAHGVRMNSAEVRPLPRGGLLAVGDSFTAGSEVGDRHSWPAQLERLTGETVVNGGVGGWATDQIILRAEELIPMVRPQVVIVSFFNDDILRAGYRVYGGANKPWFSLRDGELQHHNNPVPVFTGKPSETDASPLGYFHLATWVLERAGLADWWRQTNTSYVRAENEPIAVTCALLARLKRHTDADRIGLLLVLQHAGYDRLAKTAEPEHAVSVAECARRAGIETLDTWDPLVRANEESLEAFRRLYVMHDQNRVYSHMSAEGNALMARLIAERLGFGG